MATATGQDQYPVQFSVDYPDRPLNRVTTFFRIFTVIPIAIVLGTISGQSYDGSIMAGTHGRARAACCSSGRC